MKNKMKVGILLNKDIKNMPSFKTQYKVERNKSKETYKEIEQQLFLKNCQKFFKEVNNKRSDRNIFSIDKTNINSKTKTTVNLPIIMPLHLKNENPTINKTNISKFSSDPEDNTPNSSRNSINTTTNKKARNKTKTKLILRAKTSEKHKKFTNKINANIHRRYNLLTKKINKIKKPLFYNKFVFDEKTNKIFSEEN